MTARNDAKPLRVALAGFGVVGEGVFERLREDPQTFEVVAILSRDPRRHADKAHVGHLLTSDPDDLAGADILVEAIGGVETALRVVEQALARGADVVTANKTLVSRRHARLSHAAGATGARLRYSAAVGGGVPMLETVAELATAPIRRIDAVVNGTTNFVLDLLERSAPLADAIRAAQEAGFAEADPSNDLDGVDAAEKLSLLTREAFGTDLEPDRIPRRSLSSLSEAEIVAARAAGRPFKQIASAWRAADGVKAEISFRQPEPGSPLAEVRREENCLIVEWGDGAQTILTGKGAGRDPTADSVLSDIRRLAAERHGERGARP